MPLGHGAIAEFAVASVRGGGVQNVGSPFISGSSFAASVGDGTVTVAATHISIWYKFRFYLFYRNRNGNWYS
jgi:hypothetical protein